MDEAGEALPYLGLCAEVGFSVFAEACDVAFDGFSEVCAEACGEVGEELVVLLEELLVGGELFQLLYELPDGGLGGGPGSYEGLHGGFGFRAHGRPA